MKRIYRHENGYPCLDNRPPTNWDLYRDKGYLPVHFVETTRGCPHNCEFCSVSSSFGGKFRNRPVDEVEWEIQNLKPFEGKLTLKNVVFFADDNIISSRKHARELLTRIVPYNLKWLGQTSVNIAKDEEMMTLCRKSGCMGLLIGFETLSPDNLANVGKSFNKPHDYMDVVNKMHDHGLGVNGSFVLGFDHDDEGVFERTIEFVIRAKLDVCYFSILTPYPGTVLNTQMNQAGKIMTRLVELQYEQCSLHAETDETRAAAGRVSRVLKECFSYSAIFKRLWGNGNYKNFFYPMNFGFRQTILKTVKHRQNFSYHRKADA